MNVIFLDIDGPMIPGVVCRYHPDNNIPYPGDPEMIDSTNYWRFDERAIYLWKMLTDTRDFKVVISSTWRKFYNKPECFHDLFRVNGLELDLHEDWKTIVMSGSPYNPYQSGYGISQCMRAIEINHWIVNHPEMEEFIILDDEESGDSLCNLVEGHRYMEDRFIRVDSDTGLGRHNFAKVLHLTDTWRK